MLVWPKTYSTHWLEIWWTDTLGGGGGGGGGGYTLIPPNLGGYQSQKIGFLIGYIQRNVLVISACRLQFLYSSLLKLQLFHDLYIEKATTTISKLHT